MHGREYQYRLTVNGEAHVVIVRAGETSVVDLRQAKVKPGPNFGVDCEKLSKTDRLVYGGKEIDPRQLFAGELPDDDSKKPYLCVIGDEAFRARAKPLLAPYLDRFTVGYFAPDDWHVTGVGYRRPGISILAPRGTDGKAVELHYQPDLEGLEKAIPNALRQIDPAYDPAKTPDLRKEDALDVQQVPWWVWGVGVVVLLLLVRRKD
jgi:hypothetical protein